MSNTIQTSYGTRTYSTPAKSRETKQTGTQGSSFMDMAARASKGSADVLEINKTKSAQQKSELYEAEEMPRKCSILITVGTNLNQYRADSWPVGNDSEFHSHSKGSFWEQRMENHKKYMELQQKAAARRRMLMKLRMNGGSVSAAELLMGLL